MTNPSEVRALAEKMAGQALDAADGCFSRPVIGQLSPLDMMLPYAEALLKAEEALSLTCLKFKRAQVSGSFLGDDEHESWTACESALASISKLTGKA